MLRTTIAIAAVAVLVAGCEPPKTQAQPKITQAQKAAEAANSITFSDNAEIDNIKGRIELTSKPGLLGFVLLMNEAGQPIMYEGVRGKITSGSKRLTPTWQISRHQRDCGEWSCDDLVAAPSDEGTYGSSNEYIFYWNQDGAYRQWNGKYLYSDKPFRLRVEPLVVNVQSTAAGQ